MDRGHIRIAAENAGLDLRRFEPGQKVGRTFTAPGADHPVYFGVGEGPKEVGQPLLIEAGVLEVALDDVLAKHGFESQ